MDARTSFDFNSQEYIESMKYVDNITKDFALFRRSLIENESPIPLRQQIVSLIRGEISRTCRAYANLGKVQGFEDIPFFSKNSIRNDPTSFLNQELDPRKLWFKQTSGTTGTPVTIFYSPEFHFQQLINDVPKLAYRAGVNISAESKIYSLSITDNTSMRNWLVVDPSKSTSVRLQVVINESIPQTVARLFELINDLRPEIITAKPSTFEILISQSLSWQRREGYSPQLVVSSGSFLDEGLRGQIEDLFNTEVYNAYGLTEFGLVASECPKHDGLHTDDSRIVAEVVNEGESTNGSSKGELVLSRIDNVAMPLIRYKTGDLATMDRTPCGCGKLGVRLKNLSGRKVACFRFESGILFSPSHLNILFDVFPISEFQITQVSLNDFEVRVQPKPEANIDGLRKRIKEYIGNAFPSKVNINVDIMEFEYDSKFERYRTCL